jgi:hypothetical protein
MTTRPKGITLPQYSFIQVTNGGVQVTDTSGSYVGNNVYLYGPATISPINATAVGSTNPSSLTITAQNATAAQSSAGGSVNVVCGVGSNANPSGNLVVKDTTGAGGSWSTSHYVLGTYHLWVDAKFRLRIKASAPTTDLDGNAVGADLSATSAVVPGTIATLTSFTTTFAVANAILGDIVVGSYSLDTLGLICTYRVSAAGIVAVNYYNPTGAGITPGSGTITVKVIKS